MSPKLQNQIAKSKEQALAAFVSKKAEIDEMLDPTAGAQRRPLRLRPDDIIGATWAPSGTTPRC